MITRSLLERVRDMADYYETFLHRKPDTVVINADRWDEFLALAIESSTVEAGPTEPRPDAPMYYGLKVYKGCPLLMGDITTLVGRFSEMLPYIQREGAW